MSRRTVSVEVRYVDVDVPMEDIETSDLMAELRERKAIDPEKTMGVVPGLNTEETHPLHAIYYAFKAGLNDRATELARAFVCDELGVVL